MNKSFSEFALGIYRGLANAITTDIDVFLMANTAALLGARSRRLRAAGVVLGAYVALRRGDQYVTVLGTQLSKIGNAIVEVKREE